MEYILLFQLSSLFYITRRAEIKQLSMSHNHFSKEIYSIQLFYYHKKFFLLIYNKTIIFIINKLIQLFHIN